MDPYLEGFLWPDVHGALAVKIRQMLVPLVRPEYVVRLDISVIKDDSPEEEIGIMYPDVEVLHTAARSAGRGRGAGNGASVASASPAALSIPVLPVVDVKVVSVQVRARAKDQLVTAIEILSPVNKRAPGLEPYRRAKRQQLIESGVHLLEFDLLRRGTRPIKHPKVPPCDYLLASTRAGAGRTDLWPLGVRDVLPTLAVPLKKGHADVPLDLAAALAGVYDEAGYELSIDYREPPPPPEFAAEDLRWMKKLVASRK
jgi:hypothetical protein